MATGTVRVVDSNNGFVIITPRSGGGDITVDEQDLRDAGLTDLKMGDQVSYDIGAVGQIQHLRRVG
ncbi:cold-shock protein [Pseudomonas sp. MPB26]|uniref:cold-shock protein n=1 Tax=Pseudomonas sp. MPB26 TaxID=3388491 RepID=UPI00398551E0